MPKEHNPPFLLQIGSSSQEAILRAWCCARVRLKIWIQRTSCVLTQSLRQTLGLASCILWEARKYTVGTKVHSVLRGKMTVAGNTGRLHKVSCSVLQPGSRTDQQRSIRNCECCTCCSCVLQSSLFRPSFNREHPGLRSAQQTL
jgi:hypothetical protein